MLLLEALSKISTRELRFLIPLILGYPILVYGPDPFLHSMPIVRKHYSERAVSALILTLVSRILGDVTGLC